MIPCWKASEPFCEAAIIVYGRQEILPDFHALVGHYKLVKHPDLVKHL